MADGRKRRRREISPLEKRAGRIIPLKPIRGRRIKQIAPTPKRKVTQRLIRPSYLDLVMGRLKRRAKLVPIGAKVRRRRK